MIFLAVLVTHAAIVLLVLRAARVVIVPWNNYPEALSLMLLRPQAPAAAAVSAPSKAARRRPSKRQAIADKASTVPATAPAKPTIDWQHEAELAAKNDLARTETEGNYRDLASLSPAQRSWVDENHMQPMPQGIHWTHPRVEFDKETGIPILWINDHCVLVMLFVFCAVGHIEADGELFKHMRDHVGEPLAY